MIGLWEIAFYCSSAVLFLFGATVLCVTKFCCGGLVEDIETGRIPPTTTPTRIDVFHHLEVGLEQANSDRQAAAERNAHRGEIVQEQIIYDSSTCKNDVCVICLEELKNNQKIRFLVPCQHSFHGGCVKQWLLVNRSCPICREPIKA